MVFVLHQSKNHAFTSCYEYTNLSESFNCQVPVLVESGSTAISHQLNSVSVIYQIDGRLFNTYVRLKYSEFQTRYEHLEKTHLNPKQNNIFRAFWKQFLHLLLNLRN